MAIRYVSSAAAGGGDGSTTATSGGSGAWTFAEMLSATPAAGDEIRIMADGTYSRSATGTIAYANGTAAANIVITGANSSGVVDGTRPTIQASAGSITLLSVTGSHIRVQYLVFDGNSQSSTTGFNSTNNYCRYRFLKAQNCTAYGLRCGGINSVSMGYSEATGCSGTAAISADSSVLIFGCKAYANTTTGIRIDNSNAIIVNCLAYNNTGGSSHGFLGNTVGVRCVNCIAFGNGNDGFNLDSNNGFGSYLHGCIAYGNSAEGFGTDGVKSGILLMYCAGGNNTSGNYNATNIPNATGFTSLSANPFVDSGGGADFNLNNTSGGGADLRAVSVVL